MKRPAFMFYPADWRKNPELRVCSIAARGLWIDMMSIMHEGDPYGHLVVNGMPVTDAQLARLVGESVGLVRRLLAELETHNVFSRTDGGVMFSRRMVADEHIRNVRAAAGKLGGNPNLLDKQEVKPLVKQTRKQKPTPSVAVALAGAVAQGQEPLPPVAAVAVVRSNWLTPYADAWTARYGGKPNHGQLARAMTEPHEAHGPEETLRRWVIYLDATRADFASPSRFAATFGEWGTPSTPKQNGTKPTAAEQQAASMQRLFSGAK